MATPEPAPAPPPNTLRLQQLLLGTAEEVLRFQNLADLPNLLVQQQQQFQEIGQQQQQQLTQQQEQFLQQKEVLAQLQQQQQQHAELLQQLRRQQQDGFAAMGVRLGQVEESIKRTTMLLFNATASLEANLQYPPGIRPDSDARLPSSKKELSVLSIANCDVAINALQLPAPAAEATVVERRQLLMDFLGCAMRA